MALVIFPSGARPLLQQIVERHNAAVLKYRKRQGYGGKKGRSARRHLRELGDFLYPEVDRVIADLTRMPV